MAKKFVRGVTGIEDIESFDKTLTNVNDILSDGQNTYVHTKKGKVESYYNLTDNVKKVQSTDDLLTIDKQGDTVTIKNKSLATKIDLSSKQDKLTAGDGLAINNNQINIEPTGLLTLPAKSGLYYGNVTGDGAPYATISIKSDNNKYFQIGFRESVGTAGKIVGKYRFINNNVPTSWQQVVMDDEQIKQMLAKKQNTLTNNTSIGVNGSGLQQLYSFKQKYNVTGGLLKTHVKSVAQNTSVSTVDEEFNFIVKINKGVSSVNFTLNAKDTTKFTNIINAYGSNNTVRISGCVFTLSGSSLTVSTTNNTEQNYVITFSDIQD